MRPEVEVEPKAGLEARVWPQPFEAGGRRICRRSFLCQPAIRTVHKMASRLQSSSGETSAKPVQVEDTATSQPQVLKRGHIHPPGGTN